MSNVMTPRGGPRVAHLYIAVCSAFAMLSSASPVPAGISSLCWPASAYGAMGMLTPYRDRRRVQKHGPVFMSNLYGTKTVVVADFAGWEKVRRSGAVVFSRAVFVSSVCGLWLSSLAALWQPSCRVHVAVSVGSADWCGAQVLGGDHKISECAPRACLLHVFEPLLTLKGFDRLGYFGVRERRPPNTFVASFVVLLPPAS